MDGPARVSIVVLTHNRCEELRHTLKGLSATSPGCPLIVVDNASGDGTPDCVAREFPQALYVRSDVNLGAAGRNLGVAQVRTPYVAFADDDTCWEAGALARAAALLDGAPSVGVLNAAIRVGAHARPDPACQAMAASVLDSRGMPGQRILGFMAGACVMRVQAFRQAGGYWPGFFIGGEETLLALDLAEAGWDMVYAPEVGTRHFPSPRRDAPGRRLLLARNAIWTAWLRFPAEQAWLLTADALATLAHRRERAKAVAGALAGAGSILRRRRVLSRRVRDMYFLLRDRPGAAARLQALRY